MHCGQMSHKVWLSWTSMQFQLWDKQLNTLSFKLLVFVGVFCLIRPFNCVCGLPFKGPCDVTADKALWHVRGNSSSVLIGWAPAWLLIKCAWQQHSQWEKSGGWGVMFPAVCVLSHTRAHTQFLVSLPLSWWGWCIKVHLFSALQSSAALVEHFSPVETHGS